MSSVLNRLLMEKYGLTLDTTNQTNVSNTITFLTAADEYKPEEYNLKIEPEFIQIKGSERGIFYAIQTLRQILPLEFPGKVKIPAAVITDAPRFSYRGLHLDVARHFMPVGFVKNTLS